MDATQWCVEGTHTALTCPGGGVEGLSSGPKPDEQVHSDVIFLGKQDVKTR